jgi:hypothetical protein
MEEKSGKYGRMEVTFEIGQGQEGAVVPWMDGWTVLFVHEFFLVVRHIYLIQLRSINC